MNGGQKNPVSDRDDVARLLRLGGKRRAVPRDRSDDLVRPLDGS